MIIPFHMNAINMSIDLDTGSAKHRHLLTISDVAESLGEEYCATLLGFYVFSGEDCAMQRDGNAQAGPLRQLEKNPMFYIAYRKLGVEWNIQPLSSWNNSRV